MLRNFEIEFNYCNNKETDKYSIFYSSNQGKKLNILNCDLQTH